MSASSLASKRLKIAILGTRGIPANYGGFETFAEGLSVRLAGLGHHVTVYGRSHFVPPHLRLYRGVHIRILPSIRHKYLETVSHSALSVLVSLLGGYDVLLICNAANAFLCGIPAMAGQRVVINVDGIERLRKKWNFLGKGFYRMGEFLATVLADRVITDARAMQDYYFREYGVRCSFIPYGAPTSVPSSRDTLKSLGLRPGQYCLYVSRLEPENNAHLVIEAYRQSGIPIALVVVGDAPYSGRYIEGLRRQSSGQNVQLTGAIYGTGYRELLAGCFCYLHATEVGGTHPALIEAMGAGALVLTNDTDANREVVGEGGLLYPFNDCAALATLLRETWTRPGEFEHLRERARRRVRECYNWDTVVAQYEELLYELVSPTSGFGE